MAFQKGHPGYKPKNGMPSGFDKAKAAAVRQLSATVREKVSSDVLADYMIAIASGHNAKLAEDDDGELYVTWDDHQVGGMEVPLSERTAAIRWLSDRGHGTPVQNIALEGHLRSTQVSTSLPLAGVSPAQLAQVLAIFSPRKEVAPIDVDSAELEATPPALELGEGGPSSSPED